MTCEKAHSIEPSRETPSALLKKLIPFSTRWLLDV